MKTSKPYAVHIEKIITCSCVATQINQFYRFSEMKYALQFVNTFICENENNSDIEFSLTFRRYMYDIEGFECCEQMEMFNNIQDETYSELCAMKFDMEC